ncbi:MAG TPA: RNA methyltransferase [Cyclobacteriaceae bacterium]
MISKARIKFIKSLQVKKYRKEAQSFIVEGAKSVEELLRSDFELLNLFATDEFIGKNESLIKKRSAEIQEVTESELGSAGAFQTNTSALAIARMKKNAAPLIDPDQYALVLDDVRDPGNLGTIIRTADWYGITTIIASEETADFYNPKVISATMGSFCRVNVFYTSLNDFLSTVTTSVYGTFLNGQDIHTLSFARGGFIVIGNEANGISAEVEKKLTQKITIPAFGKAESLNAGVATAIVLDNLRRSKK